jgi:hypothetical protein
MKVKQVGAKHQKSMGKGQLFVWERSPKDPIGIS